MKNKKVWRATRKTDVLKDRRLIGCKWVFKIKRDGTYRARLAVLGYSQLQHVDFTDNFTPVVNDVTFRVALRRMMMEEFDCMLMDVETAFLYGEIEEEIYMEVPVGMKEVFSDPHETDEENAYYQILKEIYGLCQSARQFWKKFVNEMTKTDVCFKISEAAPCLLYREIKLGICMIIKYDDMMVIKHKESIIDVQERVEEVFSEKNRKQPH